MSGEDFDLAGAGEFGKVDRSAAADAGGGGFVGGDGRKMRQELAGVNEEGGYAVAASLVGDLYVAVDFKESRFLHSASLSLREREAPVGMTMLYLTFNCLSFCLSFNFVEGVGLTDVELGDGGAAQGFEMGSAA